MLKVVVMMYRSGVDVLGLTEVVRVVLDRDGDVLIVMVVVQMEIKSK